MAFAGREERLNIKKPLWSGCTSTLVLPSFIVPSGMTSES